MMFLQEQLCNALSVVVAEVRQEEGQDRPAELTRTCRPRTVCSSFQRGSEHSQCQGKTMPMAAWGHRVGDAALGLFLRLYVFRAV